MPPVQKSPVDIRAEELDTIAAALPLERRDELAELLTDQDVATLRHLVNEGMGQNTLRALVSDLAYLQAWSLAATDAALAGAGNFASQIRRPPSVGSGKAQDRPGTRYPGNGRG